MKNDIQKTIKVLQNGGLVVLPSDTVYGLLCDATNPEAVKKLFAFKERPAGKPVSIFVSDLEMAKNYVVIDKKTEDRLKEFLPGPYTVVLPSKHKAVKELESEKGTLGIRIPKYPAILDLVKKFGKPITATSANLSTRSPHYSIESLKKQTSQKRMRLIDRIVDGGDLLHNKPSTVVDFTTDNLKIIRVGDENATRYTLHVTKSEQETKDFAKKLLEQEMAKGSTKPLVFILKGDLGAGKTIFAKGLGDELGVKNIISPTYVIYYEYDVSQTSSRAESRDLSKFIHVDLYNVGDKDEFKQLGLEKYFKAGNIMCIEWGEKAGDIIEDLKEKVRLVYVSIEHKNETEREIKISV